MEEWKCWLEHWEETSDSVTLFKIYMDLQQRPSHMGPQRQQNCIVGNKQRYLHVGDRRTAQRKLRVLRRRAGRSGKRLQGGRDGKKRGVEEEKKENPWFDFYKSVCLPPQKLFKLFWSHRHDGAIERVTPKGAAESPAGASPQCPVLLVAPDSWSHLFPLKGILIGPVPTQPEKETIEIKRFLSLF